MPALKSEQKNDVLVLGFTDVKILDEAKIQQIGKELLEHASKTPAGKLLVNFTGVTFMSSAMIGKIILLNNTCKQGNVKLKLCDICENVMEVFRLTRLNKILDIQPTEEKALPSFDKKGWFG